MITKITINNFKKLDKISFEFSDSVVIIGPNNGGKTTIFQALCLWKIGVVSYLQAEKRKTLNQNSTVTINRKSLINSPVEAIRDLWQDKKIYTYLNGGLEDRKLEVAPQPPN